MRAMRLYLINPSNPLVSIVNVKESRWNRYRVWKPLSRFYLPGEPRKHGVDTLNALFLTPLPGTRLWDRMKSEGRIACDTFPENWKDYTLTFPVARYKHLSLDAIIEEMLSCERDFYSMRRIVRRLWTTLWRRRKPLISLVSSLSYWRNVRLNHKIYAEFKSNSRTRVIK
jgi:radical SAM superfamily enzyme YgiQ (UPF0313 family)